MTVWDEVRPLIEGHDALKLAEKTRELDAAARRAVAQELPGYLRAQRDEDEFWLADSHLVRPLLVAGVGTISGAAEAAAWICRTELRGQSALPEEYRRVAELCARVAEGRPAGWREDVARRVAAKIRARWQDVQQWHVAAALVLAAGSAPPEDEAFVLGWVQWGIEPYRPADHPFIDALVPRIFEVEGIGNRLLWPQEGPGAWHVVLADLAREGRVKREMLLDGCVRRFLRGGRAQDLRWFVRLHEALAPDVGEAAERVRDYVRLLPSSPGPVAELAFRQIKRVDETDGLDDALFTEAAEALLFRPEKKVVRAALTWLGGTARKRDRVDATLRAVTSAFTSDDFDLRERAAKVAAKHAACATEQARQAVREAAADLPGELRQKITTACGPVEAAEPVPVGPVGLPPFVPRELPPPIASPAELAEEYLVQLSGDHGWAGVERVLAGLVELGFREPEETREALLRIAPGSAPWLLPGNPGIGYSGHPSGWLAQAGRAFTVPAKKEARASLLSAVKTRIRDRLGDAEPPAPLRLIRTRIRDVISSIGQLPVLAAAPTTASGHVDPAELVARMERLEATQVQPGAAELDLALLRLPRDVDAATISRAGMLASPAGKTVAQWLATGGLADPEVSCAAISTRSRDYFGHSPEPVCAVLATIAPPEAMPPGDLRRLCDLRATEVFDTIYDHDLISWWPAVMPSHPEVIAAHMLPYLANWVEQGHEQGAALLGLAEADGPAGPATAAALVYGLNCREQTERAGAVDALLALAARGRLPAVELGAVLGALVGHQLVKLDRSETPLKLSRVDTLIKLNRVTESLADAARAGAHTEVWTAIAAALPRLLPEKDAKAPAGLPGLLALGLQTAESAGARGDIPELAAVAGRGGSSRLVREASRLHRQLTSP